MSPKELSKEEVQRIYTVESFVINHLDEFFTIQELARRAALGEQRFKDGFYRLFEKPVGEYIHEARMRTGRFLLIYTCKTIKEIAFLCGYAQARNFSSAYKSFFGTSPNEERQRGH